MSHFSLLSGQPAADGAGVKIRRVHGFNANELDPFLMLDELHSRNPEEYLAGFPEHPHRGFETLSYMRHGRFHHRDHMGNEGEIGSGGAQWMSAGSGVIHAEMPAQEEGELHGFQLWINLPARDKMKAPQYRDLSAQQLPWQSPLPGMKIKLIGGRLALGQVTLQGPLQLPAEAVVADLELAPGQALLLPLQPQQRILFYPYRGALASPELVERGQLANWLGLTSLELRAGADGVGGLLLLGEPINEPMAHYGPFVMNTVEELREAIADFQQGRLTIRPPRRTTG